MRKKTEKKKKKTCEAEEEEEEEEGGVDEDDGDEEEVQEHSVEEQVEQKLGPSLADIRKSIGSISSLFSADIPPPVHRAENKSPKEDTAEHKSTYKHKSSKEERATNKPPRKSTAKR